MTKKIFFILRILVAGIFIISGFTKLMEPYQNLLAVIYGYKLVGGWLAKSMAIVLPWAELIFSVFLLAGLWIRISTAALWAMNSMFIGAISLALIRKLPIHDCGCFGETVLSMPLQGVLILDIVLWVIFAGFFLFPKKASFCSIDFWASH